MNLENKKAFNGKSYCLVHPRITSGRSAVKKSIGESRLLSQAVIPDIGRSSQRLV